MPLFAELLQSCCWGEQHIAQGGGFHPRRRPRRNAAVKRLDRGHTRRSVSVSVRTPQIGDKGPAGWPRCASYVRFASGCCCDYARADCVFRV
ncbi:hypothetical protein AAFF_G00293990 [Aldrovandia affinis]|uniref:Uncharacterized protein n=1 Tax=Aldrovandia affinis TaxID=143900 RepID=A0AAD7W197_9TELE|nr:hypothetical protein AAFF_G00293990 [Aldrovandia affinis]